MTKENALLHPYPPCPDSSEATQAFLEIPIAT